MTPRKFLQQWADEQRRAFLAAVGLSETQEAAQTASAENQEPILEELARSHPLNKPPSIPLTEQTHPLD